MGGGAVKTRANEGKNGWDICRGLWWNGPSVVGPASAGCVPWCPPFRGAAGVTGVVLCVLRYPAAPGGLRAGRDSPGEARRGVPQRGHSYRGYPPEASGRLTFTGAANAARSWRSRCFLGMVRAFQGRSSKLAAKYREGFWRCGPEPCRQRGAPACRNPALCPGLAFTCSSTVTELRADFLLRFRAL